MNAQQYILAALDELKSPVQVAPLKKSESLEDAIYAKVMSKKFRKVKADDRVVETTREAIAFAVKNNQPLRMCVLFGGNKLWRLDEAPEIDWAELFSAIYYTKWMKYIASVYEPGVSIAYYAMDISVEELDNIPKADLYAYYKSFMTMLDFIQPYLPERVELKYTKYGDLFDGKERYNKEREEARVQWLEDNGGKLPEMTPAKIAATELNVKLLPGQDDDPDWRAKNELMHRAAMGTKTMKKYRNAGEIIQTCPIAHPNTIGTGSTKKSYAKFWVGVGALEQKGDSYNQIVLTPKQLETAKFDWQDIEISGLKGKNFAKIRIAD